MKQINESRDAPRLNLSGKLRLCAQMIRHAPRLAGLEWLWNAARKIYLKVLLVSSRGVAVIVGDCFAVLMPPELTTTAWESYEVEEVQHVVQWLREHPRGLILDVGSSIGIYSLIGLSVSPETEVIAFDSDLASLEGTRRMCRSFGGNRLRMIHGFISNQHASGLDVDSASQTTKEKLIVISRLWRPGMVAYGILGIDSDASIPISSLDGLWAKRDYPEKSVLIKCDVEGAEQLVLQGAPRLLARKSTTLSVSVHPPQLPRYGHSAESVRRLLENAGYKIEILAVDHEEHWWCERNAV